MPNCRNRLLDTLWKKQKFTRDQIYDIGLIFFDPFCPSAGIKYIGSDYRRTDGKLCHIKIQIAGECETPLSEHPAFRGHSKNLILNRKKIRPALVPSIKYLRHSGTPRSHHCHAGIFRHFSDLRQLFCILRNKKRDLSCRLTA